MVSFRVGVRAYRHAENEIIFLQLPNAVVQKQFADAQLYVWLISGENNH